MKYYCKRCNRMRDQSHFYFTKKGRRQSMCKDCHREYYREQRKDPVKLKQEKERHARYYRSHKKEHKQYYVDKYQDPVEHQKQLERQRKWAREHKAYVSERARIWYVKNKKRVTKRRRAYDKLRWANNPEVRERKNRQKDARTKIRLSDPAFVRKRKSWVRNSNHRRRIRMADAKANVSSLTDAEWQAILDKYGHRCLACGRSDAEITLDHIVPVTMNGKHVASNVQPLCRACNTRKGKRTIDYRPRKGE